VKRTHWCLIKLFRPQTETVRPQRSAFVSTGGQFGDLPLSQRRLALPARRTWIPNTPLVIFS
jgi:hypothetical protein